MGEPEKSQEECEREHKEKIRRKSAEYQGNFHLSEQRYEEALKHYKDADAKTKVRELGELCIRRGESKVAIDAYAFFNASPSEQQLRNCAERCLKEGRLEQALVAYRVICKTYPDLDWPEVGEDPSPESIKNLLLLAPYEFRICGEACEDRGRRTKDEAESQKLLEQAVCAYELAELPERIARIADELMRESQSDPQKKKAQEVYDRAARLAIRMEGMERVRNELEKELLRKPGAHTSEEEFELLRVMTPQGGYRPDPKPKTPYK